MTLSTYLNNTVMTTNIDANVPSYVQTAAMAKFKPWSSSNRTRMMPYMHLMNEKMNREVMLMDMITRT